MRRIASFMSFFAAMFLLAACASVTSNSSKLKIDDVLTRASVMRFPYEKTTDGHLLIPVSVNGREASFFAIDTGATRSVIFNETSVSLNLTQTTQPDIIVHGLVEAEGRPIVKLAKLEIGYHKFFDIDVAVLGDRKRYHHSGQAIEGLIGLDILSRFRLYLDVDNRHLYFIPGTTPEIRKPSQWKYVSLVDNPYKNDGRDLNFFIADFDGQKSPVLLDSGSAVNFMNWRAANHSKIRRIKKRLKKQWSIEGATGTFNPKVYVTFDFLFSGDKYWHQESFVVSDLSSLDVLGISGKPFAIAGIGLLSADSFYLDFANNTLFMQDRNNKGYQPVPGSRSYQPIERLPPS